MTPSGGQATKVTFGGVKATTMVVNSDTQVTANVPTGAKTGKIAIATPGGTATRSPIFTVTRSGLGNSELFSVLILLSGYSLRKAPIAAAEFRKILDHSSTV